MILFFIYLTNCGMKMSACLCKQNNIKAVFIKEAENVFFVHLKYLNFTVNKKKRNSEVTVNAYDPKEVK